MNGATDFLYQPVMELYKYLDNYSSTTHPTYVDGYFSFTGDTYNRALEGCNWEVRGIENQQYLNSGLYLSVNNRSVATRTDSFTATCFPIFDKLINGNNYWKIGLNYFTDNANNVQWEVERNRFAFTVVKDAWASSSLAPGASTVDQWQDGWDYARVCGTIGTVTAPGGTDLYNNGVKVASRSISSSDSGDEVCWSLSSSEVSGTNYFNLKPNGGTNLTISNMHFELHYFTGQPSIQAVRTVSPQPAQVSQDIAVTLTLNNNGSNVADEPEYADTLPSGLTLVSGALSGGIVDIDPGTSAMASYTVRASTVGAYTIPTSTIIFEDYANNNYQTTVPATTIEVFGGTLQPVTGSIENGEVGSPIAISATVTDSLTGGIITDATVVANIAKPDSGLDSLALSWNAANNRYEASYFPTTAGQHQVSTSASRLYHTGGTSASQLFTVQERNSIPIANLSVAPVRGPSPLTLTLDGRASVDTDGVISSYEWDIDSNGSIDATGTTAEWTLSTTGDHTIKLTVTDNRGGTASDTITVAVLNPFPAPISLTATPQSPTQILINWQDQSQDESWFEIERSTNENIGWSVIDTVNSNTATYTDSNLTCETQYYYRVRAYRSADDAYSSYSNSSSAYTLTCPILLPEINLIGNNIYIANGDSSPSASDHTDFGSVAVANGTISRTFTISNSGQADLILTETPKVTVSGTNAIEFSVSTQPASPITPDSSSIFTVDFDPNGEGIRNAVISIASNDADESPFTFTIQGKGLNPPQTFNKLAPQNEATSISTNPTLTWEASAGATSYEYCFDTNLGFSCSNWTNAGANTNVTLSGLNSDTVNYWQVRAINSAGTTYANGDSTSYWSFTTQPAAPVCYLLTLTKSGSGAIPSTSPANSPNCPVGQFVAGASIGLIAYPASGYHVGSWSGTSNDTSTATSNNLSMPADPHTVTVFYEQDAPSGGTNYVFIPLIMRGTP